MFCSRKGNGIPITCTATSQKWTGQPIHLAGSKNPLTLGMGVSTTVPFLLLAAFCFARSSERLHAWFQETKLYKENLEDYVAGNGMRKQAKIRIMCTVTVLMSIGFILMSSKGVYIGCIVLACVWILHILYFCFKVKTIAE